jgi:hypothetical protein
MTNRSRNSLVIVATIRLALNSRQGQDRPAVGPTQPPVLWVPAAFSGGKTAGA